MSVASPVELLVYKKAYDLAMNIYDVSKKWSREEKYALTDQIRRSSRSVCAIYGRRGPSGGTRLILSVN